MPRGGEQDGEPLRPCCPRAIAAPWPVASRGFNVEAGNRDLTVQADTDVRYPLTRMDA